MGKLNTTMAINLFFNKIFNNKDYKNIKSTDDNFIITGNSLSKIDNLNYKYKGIFNDFSVEENKKVIFEKKKLEEDLRKKISKKILKKFKPKIKIHYGTAHSLERLLMHHNQGNFDVNTFFLKYKKKILKSKINFYYAGNYDLTEHLALIYWLFLFDKIGNHNLSFYVKDKNFNYRVLKNRKFFLHQILCNDNSINIASKGLPKKTKQNILFIDGVRQKDYWYRKYNPTCVSNNIKFKDNFLHIGINNFLYNYEIKLFEDFLNKNSIDLKRLNSYHQKVKIIESFLLNFTLKIIEQRFRDISKNLKKSLNIKKIKNFFVPATPFMESIIILNYLKIKKKNIYILPHSTTPSYEIHPNTYLKQYCFTRSNKIMPSVKWHTNNLKKGIILKKNLFNSFSDKSGKYVLSQRLKLIKSFIYNLKFNIIINKLSFFSLSKINFIYQKLFFKFFLNKAKTIGIILNIELYQSTTLIDYNRQNQLITKIFKLCLITNNYLLIRRKPGHTNFLLMKDYFNKHLKSETQKNLFLMDDSFMIQDYLKNLNLCVFLQCGSAMIESIKNRVPVILVKDNKCPEYNEPYVKFPKNIVPQIEIKDLSKFLMNKDYLKKLLKKQSDFVKINL
jgi:hypothetical protein